MDKWQHTMCWIEWLLPWHFTSSWYFFLDFLTLLSTHVITTMGNERTVSWHCLLFTTTFSRNCIWQPYLENRKLFGLSGSLLLSFYALSSTISYDRLSWSQAFEWKGGWKDMLSILTSHEILYDDVLTRRWCLICWKPLLFATKL